MMRFCEPLGACELCVDPLPRCCSSILACFMLLPLAMVPLSWPVQSSTVSVSASVSTSLAASASTTEVRAVPAGRRGPVFGTLNMGAEIHPRAVPGCGFASRWVPASCALIPYRGIVSAFSHVFHAFAPSDGCALVACAVRHGERLSERQHVPCCLRVHQCGACRARGQTGPCFRHSEHGG